MERSLQEVFWAGGFGDNYVDRNASPELVSSNIALFAQVLKRTGEINSICELGANIGLNLIALHQLLPKALLTGIEINQKAANQLATLPYVEAKHGSFYEICASAQSQQVYDFVFTKGVLIHQGPENLPKAYDILYSISKRYIMVCEYYNPSPVEIEYRGNKSVLFKRDFAGELLDRYTELKLIDYGFVYHRDTRFPCDDVTWFLIEKQDIQ